MISSTSASVSITKTTATTMGTSSLDDMAIIKTIQNATEGLPSCCYNHLSNSVFLESRKNALAICDYISSLKSEINPLYNYRRDTIVLLCHLSTFFKNANCSRR